MFQRIFATLFALALTGCAASGPATPSAAAAPPVSNPPTAQPSAPGPAAQPAVAASPAATPSGVSALPTVPNGARFTIFCESYNGADHVKFASELKALLTKNTKLRDWYVIHQKTQSSLYHGYYAEIDPNAANIDKSLKRDAERAKRDFALVQSIPNPQSIDRKLFPGSLIVPLDAPDPDAPPAWNLTNAPGYWSVQVAAFTGADRKRQTVEAVRQARASNIPAYYYHGPAVSSVCVGSWDKSAVKTPEYMAAPGDQDLDKDAKRNKDRDVVLNMSGESLNQSSDDARGADGNKMRTLQSTAEVVDPELIKTLAAYPAQAVDGYDVQLKGTDKANHPVLRTRPSMIVMIPHTDPAAAVADKNASQTNEPAPTLINPNAGQSDLGSRLRGIGQ